MYNFRNPNFQKISLICKGRDIKKNKTTKSPIHEFKVLQNYFENILNEKTRLTKKYTIIKGF